MHLSHFHIVKYGTQLSCIFQHRHCIFVTILFGPFARLFFNLAMRMRAFFTKIATTLRLAEQAFWRMLFFTEWIGASSFEVILARPSKHATTGTLASGTSGSQCIFSFCCMKEFGQGFECVDFARLLTLRRKLQLSLLEHCPLISITNNLLESFVHAFLSPDSWPQRSFYNFRFWPQNSCSANHARYFFSPLSSICDSQVQLSSGEPPYCAIPLRSWVSLTL